MPENGRFKALLLCRCDNFVTNNENILVLLGENATASGAWRDADPDAPGQEVFSGRSAANFPVHSTEKGTPRKQSRKSIVYD